MGLLLLFIPREYRARAVRVVDWTLVGAIAGLLAGAAVAFLGVELTGANEAWGWVMLAAIIPGGLLGVRRGLRLVRV